MKNILFGNHIVNYSFNKACLILPKLNNLGGQSNDIEPVKTKSGAQYKVEELNTKQRFFVSDSFREILFILAWILVIITSIPLFFTFNTPLLTINATIASACASIIVVSLYVVIRQLPLARRSKQNHVDNQHSLPVWKDIVTNIELVLIGLLSLSLFIPFGLSIGN